MKIKTPLFLLAFTAIFLPATAQTKVNALLQKTVLAMGAHQVNSIRYFGSGESGVVGQNHSPHSEWPVLIIKSYTRTLDYSAWSSLEESVRAYQSPPSKGGGAPFLKEQKQTVQVPGLPPSPDDMEERHLQILLTPHGFLKQAVTNKTTHVKKVKGGGTEITMSTGKFRFVALSGSQGFLEKIVTWVANPVLGDMKIETAYSDYKDHHGIKIPWRIVQNTGGHMALNLTLSGVETNVSDLAPVAGPATAPVPAVEVNSNMLSKGVWFIGGGSHNSLLIEFNDYVAVIEAPNNEARSLAVIAEVKRLVPSKPIRYIVNTHHHFDHSGGLRTYVAEGATVITGSVNPRFYTEAWKAPRTLAPDRLSQHPGEPVFIAVEDSYVLSDSVRTLELYHNQGSNHNAGMLFGYLPGPNILFVADEYSPGRLINGKLVPVAKGFANNLNLNLDRLNLEIETIAPAHGNVVPYTELLNDIGQ